MKLILFFTAIVLLLWLLRSSWRRRSDTPASPEKTTQAQPMLACAVCGIHMPRDEMLPGKGGVFCGDAHRAEFEKSHPSP